jgi:hypothetical protein
VICLCSLNIFDRKNQSRSKPTALAHVPQSFVRLRSCEGYVYSAANEFLCDLEGLRREILSQRELQKIAQSRSSGSSFRPISSFHTDPRYDGDLHQADMAWALNAAGHGISEEQIENEIFRGRDLSKKGSRARQFNYVARTARKAIAISTD